MQQDSGRIELYPHLFAVDETAVVFWERKGQERQLSFLNAIDAKYFEYVARINEPELDGEQKLRAAAAVRLVYSQALECLFALIGAALQAPTCPAGWMLKYRVSDIESLLKKITSEQPFRTRLFLKKPGWRGVIPAILPLDPDATDADALYAPFIRLWKSLAKEFTDEHFQPEYNSLKHGFRVRSGEWFLAMGREETPGVRAPASAMRLVSKSNFGSSFLMPVNMKRYQFQFAEQRVNWNPHAFIKRMPLIVMSIENVVTTLQMWNGAVPDTAHFSRVTSEMISAAWDESLQISTSKLGFRPHFSANDFPDLTAQEILSIYD